MNFRDNVIREYLKNVYFVTGTPCGGKTTVSRGLGKKYNIPVYDVETAKATVSATLKSLNDKPYLAIKESGYFWLERDLNRSVEDTINLVAEHFGLNNFSN